MWYVYILESTTRHFVYTGSTNNLERRVNQHNSGEVISTKPYKPLKLKAYIAVEDQTKAIELEQYLKSGSGRAFLHKRIL
jgi:putative endonuclease